MSGWIVKATNHVGYGQFVCEARWTRVRVRDRVAELEAVASASSLTAVGHAP